jgi:NADPH-dependent 2,4-dienoyl-CoA reductase/sulfur reductase-like enzyme
MGATLSTLHERNGVCLRTGISVADVKGDSAVSAVELSDGTVLPTDVLVIGIGARPATDWLTDSGIALHRRDGGIICDRQLATSVAGVWAAGDVAWWDNETLGQQMRLENWTNASQQGTHAGRNAVRRDPTGFGTVPYYWTDWYQQRIQFVGIAPSDEVHLTGSVAESRFIAIYRTGSTITGAVTLNQPGRIMKLRAMVAAGRSWDEAMAFVDRVGLA